MESAKPHLPVVFDRKKLKQRLKISTSDRCTETMQNKCV